MNVQDRVNSFPVATVPRGQKASPVSTEAAVPTQRDTASLGQSFNDSSLLIQPGATFESSAASPVSESSSNSSWMEVEPVFGDLSGPRWGSRPISDFEEGEPSEFDLSFQSSLNDLKELPDPEPKGFSG